VPGTGVYEFGWYWDPFWCPNCPLSSRPLFAVSGRLLILPGPSDSLNDSSPTCSQDALLAILRVPGGPLALAAEFVDATHEVLQQPAELSARGVVLAQVPFARPPSRVFALTRPLPLSPDV
jgi:hypothetical protein